MASNIGNWRRPADWQIFLLLAALTLIVRAQTFNDPVLGFDEQYYLLVAHRMWRGATLYVDIWDRKPVGLFLIYLGAIVGGGDPFLRYKLLAAAFVAVTAFVLYRVARWHGSRFGALSAAVLYILWLNLMEGEGGQSPVFYNLPVLLAAALTWRAVETRQALFVRGCLAMLLIGIAIQIKYTAVFEGMFFGLCLCWSAWQAEERKRFLLFALAWIALALLPTALALAFYIGIGQTQAFLFANFFSIFGKKPDPILQQLEVGAAILALLTPLAVLAVPDWRRIGFPQIWAIAALIGMLLFGSFLALGYGLPVVTPLCIGAAVRFSTARRRVALSLAINGAALLAGQWAVHQGMTIKGGRQEALALAAAAHPRRGCLWVYDGYPDLYMLANSCLPTRWAFPGHLNTADEDSARAIGVDPVAEVRRILATRPDTIVDRFPPYPLHNPRTRRVLEAALARDYHLVARFHTDPSRYRFRLVYRRNGP